jgi:hypothetical protein
MSGWPNPLKPGMPLNPEKDGWHWLADPASTQFYFWHRPVKWIGEIKSWLFGGCVTWREMNETGWRYLGPCLKPAEADNLLVENARLREALENSAIMIQGCYDAPTNPNSLPQMLLHYIRAALEVKP